MTHTQQAIDALAIVQHLWLCEDEGISSGQPSKEEYLRARDIVDQALAALRSPAPMDLEATMEIIKCEVRNALGATKTGVHEEVAFGVAWMGIKHRIAAHVETHGQATSVERKLLQRAYDLFNTRHGEGCESEAETDLYMELGLEHGFEATTNAEANGN